MPSIISISVPWRHPILTMLVGFNSVACAVADVVPWSGAVQADGPHVTHVDGVEVVNIAAPNGAGVSVNHFATFDIAPAGVALNNSQHGVDSQLAGALAANPALGGGPASLIIHEVHATHASTLQGPLEVAGTRADVIISNPVGLHCDGCGFINANKVILTTGTPTLDFIDGSLVSLGEPGGGISIGPQGVRTWPNSAPELELYARSLLVNGPIEVQQLTGTAAGSNPSHGSQEIEGEEPAVAIALTSNSMLRAQHVTLVATRKGAGIHARGRIDTEQLRISAGGELYLDGAALNVASVQGGAAAALEGPLVLLEPPGSESQEEVSAFASPRREIEHRVPSQGVESRVPGQGVGFATQASLEGESIKMRASTLTVDQGRLYMDARMGSLQSEMSTVQADTLLDVRAHGRIARGYGQWGSGGDFRVHAGSFWNEGSLIVAQGDATLHADVLANPGSGIKARSLRLDAYKIDNRGGTLWGESDVVIHANKLDNRALPKPVAADFRTHPMRDVRLTEGLTPGASAQFSAPDEASHGIPGLVASGGTMSLRLHQLDNQDGAIYSHDALDLDVRGELGNVHGSIASSDSVLRIDAGGAVDNTQGSLEAGRALALHGAGTLHNGGGRIASMGDVRLILASGSPAALPAGGVLNNGPVGSNTGLIQAGGALEVVAAEVDNRQGFAHGKQVDFRVMQLRNRLGSVRSDQDLKVSFDILRNGAGKLDAARNVLLQGTQMPAGAGTVNAGGDLRMNVLEIEADAKSSLRAAGDVELNGEYIHLPEGGAIQADKKLTVTVEALETAGTLESAADLQVRAGRRLRNVDGRIASARGDVELALGHGHLFNLRGKKQGGLIVAGGGMRVSSGVLDNTESRLEAGGAMELHVRGALKNEGGTLQAGRTLQASIDGALRNNVGLIAAPDVLSLRAGGAIDNRTGQIRSTATEVAPADAAAGRVTVETPRNLFDNRERGMVWARGPALVSASDLENGSGLIRGSAVTISADEARNGNAGRVKADVDGLTVHARTLDNRTGKLRSVGALNLQLDDVAHSVVGDARTEEGPMRIDALR